MAFSETVYGGSTQEFPSDSGHQPDILVEATPRGSSSLEDDTILISRIQAGDREALAILYERYLPSIWRYVYSRLRGNEAASRDVVSETFLAAIQGIGRLDAASTHVAGWLSGIARHKLVDHWRRSTPQIGMQDPDLSMQEADPVAMMDASDTRQAVGKAMESMDDLERVVLEWKYLEGLTVREMAERLGRTEKATEGILYRARLAFRTHYQKATRSV
jgi:RNA polymerase sigma-70 factor (ECF subfamily)